MKSRFSLAFLWHKRFLSQIIKGSTSMRGPSHDKYVFFDIKLSHPTRSFWIRSPNYKNYVLFKTIDSVIKVSENIQISPKYVHNTVKKTHHTHTHTAAGTMKYFCCPSACARAHSSHMCKGAHSPVCTQACGVLCVHTLQT